MSLDGPTRDLFGLRKVEAENGGAPASRARNAEGFQRDSRRTTDAK